MKAKSLRFSPILMILLFTMLFFRKSLIWGAIPAPFDLLVAWFFPFSFGGWTGVGNFLLYKGGHFASDAFRQQYLWRELATDFVKQGTVPLWNPYAFSGTPLLANFQSAVFYPMNLVFFLLKNFSQAWTLYIASAVFLGAMFMLIFLKSLKLGNTASLLGAIAFAASGYVIVWLEWGVIVHELLWLPLSLFAVKRWWDSQKVRFLFILVLSISSTIFAGFAQGAAYNLIILLTWIGFLSIEAESGVRTRKLLPIFSAIVMSLGITSIQWLPTAELYFHSAMRGEVSQTLSREAALPIPQLATLLVPDYFGNRVTDDYWGKEIGNVDYMDADFFLGIGTLVLAVSAMTGKKKRKEIRWLMFLLVLGLALGTKTPITAFIADLNIPVISTGGASEATLISLFALCCLAALALEELKRTKIGNTPLLFIGVLYTMLFGATFFFDPDKASIARNALWIPVSAAVLTGAVLLFHRKNILSGTLAGAALIVIVSAELLLHAEKILPFSSPDFVYPRHELFEELRKRAGVYRIDGFWESEIVTNIPTAYRLYSAEGYDPLYLRRYGELLTSAQKGELVSKIPRSDADITMENEVNRNRLIDLVSVKYIVAKVTDPQETWEEEPLKYDPERFKLVWQSGAFKIYENLPGLPRAKIFSDWRIIEDDSQIIQTLYDPEFNPQGQVILEKDPAIAERSTASGQNIAELPTVRITDYKANSLEVQTESEEPAVLLLTDAFHTGWEAAIDGIPSEILRANYAFRAVVVPEGNHRVTFAYRPKSFLLGKMFSLFSLFSILLLMKIRVK